MMNETLNQTLNVTTNVTNVGFKATIDSEIIKIFGTSMDTNMIYFGFFIVVLMFLALSWREILGLIKNAFIVGLIVGAILGVLQLFKVIKI